MSDSVSATDDPIDPAVNPIDPANPGDPVDPRHGGRLDQLFRGMGYLFRGWGFIGKHPSLVKYCILPTVLTILVFLGVGFLLYQYYGELVALIWAKPTFWLTRIFWYLLYVLIFVAVMLIGYVAFFVVQGIVTAPFNDLLSEKVEEIAYGREPQPFVWSIFAKGIVAAILHEVAKLALWLAVMIPLFLFSFVPVIGTLVFAIGGFITTTRFFAYDHLDYSMARRLWSFKRKRAALKQNRSLTSGFGAGVTLVLLIPVVGLLSIPMAAVGGTLLFCDLEKVGAFETASPMMEAGEGG
ncbi:MAG: EI24 domain-containing protein [Deltaproteobacteria bacterium]|nr:EI24 domain-containing protein [Deltaproteobacteria bacterium]